MASLQLMMVVKGREEGQMAAWGLEAGQWEGMIH